MEALQHFHYNKVVCFSFDVSVLLVQIKIKFSLYTLYILSGVTSVQRPSLRICNRIHT